MEQNKTHHNNSLKQIPDGAVQHITAGPYSPLLIIDPGKLVVLSGQAAIDHDGHIVGDNIEEQTEYMLQNCSRLLAQAGCSMDDVFKATVYLKSIADWSAFNTIYKNYFKEPLPVRTAIQTGLIGELLVEIEIWAIKA